MQKAHAETGKTVKTGFWRDAWHRLCKNKGAMLGLFLLLALSQAIGHLSLSLLLFIRCAHAVFSPLIFYLLYRNDF